MPNQYPPLPPRNPQRQEPPVPPGVLGIPSEEPALEERRAARQWVDDTVLSAKQRAGMNAFVACTASHDEAHVHDDLIFLICGSCKTVTEAPSPTLKKSCLDLAQANNFGSELERIEVHGICSDCANA